MNQNDNDKRTKQTALENLGLLLTLLILLVMKKMLNL